MGYSKKNPNRGGGGGGGVEDMEFAKGIKEIACGISRGLFKTKWDLQG